jgi:peptide chain release factor subunit 3
LIFADMSKLNAGAFEFVPGRGLTLPQRPPQSSPPPPVQRPEPTEAPPPPPTISLNIGGAKSTPQPRPSVPVSQPQSQASTPPIVTVKPQASSATKTFTTEKSKSDTNTVAQEVRAAADRAILEDLYGNGKLLFGQLGINLKYFLS